jgi:hypothetical protein
VNSRKPSLVVSALIFLASPAVSLAVEFRGVEIGDTCRQAAEVEAKLGTQPQQEVASMVDFNVVIFEDASIAGQHSKFIYNCTKNPGIVSRYSIDIRTRDESRARELYAAAKAAAVARLGAPQFDSDSPEMKAKTEQARLKGLIPHHAVANWGKAWHQRVSVALERDDDEWRISTFVSEAPEQSIKPNR